MAGLSPDYLLRGLTLEPGALETLTTLRARHLLGICTNRDSDMGPVVNHFGLNELVDVILTAEHVDNPKPHPEMLLKAAAELGLAAGSLVYVGDTGVDAQAAEAAGITFIRYDRAGRGHCEDASPAVTISDLRELPRCLTALTGSERAAGPAAAN
jgi:phosphoglycolate phosphatase-like HAD superfamily hydrolase